jgi:hypothetical protein
MKILITERQINYLVLMEASKHTENLYKSWAKKKSGNEIAALSIMDDVLLVKLPQDFSKYSSYDELKSDLDKIKKVKQKKEVESDVIKLYKDDTLEVVHPNTWQASCDYGATSKWCTTSRKSSTDWLYYNTFGTEFFWVFKDEPKSSPEHKYSYHIHFAGGVDWCNAINDCVSSLPGNSRPKQHPKYKEIIDRLKRFSNERETEINNIKRNNENFLINKLQLIDLTQFVDINKIINIISSDFKFDTFNEIYRWYRKDTENPKEFDVNDIINSVDNSILEDIDNIDYDDIYKTLIVKIRKYLTENEGLPPSKNYADKDLDIEAILNKIDVNLGVSFMEILKSLWDDRFKELYPELGIYI